MYSNKFSVRIPEGNEVKDQYVEMRHGQTYSIVMRNHRNVPCDAVVTIDGQVVGTWRIYALSNIRIERPADKARLFTFYKLGSNESQQAGLVNDDSLGLVSVEFKPARRTAYAIPKSVDVYRDGSKGGMFGGDAERTLYSSPASRSAGGTGLSGSSTQKFDSVSALDYDMSEAYTIHLRLVAVESVPDIEPLTPRSTAIPPRIA